MSTMVCELEMMGSWEGTREGIVYAYRMDIFFKPLFFVDVMGHGVGRSLV